jgi:predicted SnoaL-like aldol condensation-catalyzing enzyme
MSILRTLSYDRVNGNREMSTLYHELKPEDVENILADDFIGHLNDDFTWTKEDHFYFHSNNASMKDTITYQIAEGNWVATTFHRTGNLEGRAVKGDMMQFKRFEDGKIAEIFEYADPGQWE